MKIILPVKQVPESGAVRMDEATGTVIRKDADAVVNPLDLYAVECALRIGEKISVESLALSMGPRNAEQALREVMSMGISDGVLVSDRAYAGSDTWASANILAAAIRKLGAFDLIICGERATDGDTGQVGPELAAALHLPMAGYVTEILEAAGDHIRVRHMAEGGTGEVLLHLPALITVVKAVGEPRLPTLKGKMAARRKEITRLGQTELNLPPDRIGLNGSPTRVVKIFHPRLTRSCRMICAEEESQREESVAELLAFLREKELVQ